MNKIKSILMAVAMLMSFSMKGENIKSESLHVWFELPTIVADGETVNYLKVYEREDNDMRFTGFNMYFIFPEGVKINQVKSGREMKNDIALNPDRTTGTHSISCRFADKNQLNVISNSSENALLYNTDEDGNSAELLYTIGLIFDPSVNAGTYQIIMNDIVFGVKDATGYEPANMPVYYDMVVSDHVTSGIEEILADEMDATECYNLMGVRIDPKKAYNQIVIYKGRKVYVK